MNSMLTGKTKALTCHSKALTWTPSWTRATASSRACTSPTRYYRDLYENRTDIKLHIMQPLSLGGFEDARLTGGVSMVRTTRSMSENQFGFEATSANFFDESNGDLEATSRTAISWPTPAANPITSPPPFSQI